MSNQITVTGYLGRPAETRITKTGRPVTTLTLAETPREKKDGDWVDGQTIWFKVTLWDSLPEVVYDKGAKVIVTGSLRKEVYEVDGVTKESLVILADSVGICHRITERPVPQATLANESPTAWGNTSMTQITDSTPF